MSDLRLSLSAESRTVLVEWTRPAVSRGTPLLAYRVASQIVGIGDCDDQYRGTTSYDVVDSATTTRLIGDITPWRRYRVVVSSLYDDGGADAVAEISSIETGQLISVPLPVTESLKWGNS